MTRITMRPPVHGRAVVHALSSEDQFERWVIAAARVYGWRGYHTRKSYGSVMGVEKLDAYGWPDWAFWHPKKGRFMLRELKAQAGRVTAPQRRVLAELAACGIDIAIWRPSDEKHILETFAA